MPWTTNFHLDKERRHVRLQVDADGVSANRQLKIAISELLDTARDEDIFPLGGYGEEEYAVIGTSYQGLSIDRAGHNLFGITGRGVHMTVYTRTDTGIKIWVPRRSQTVWTHRGLLDNSIAGGVSSGEFPGECIVREAAEEARLPEDLVRNAIKPCGSLSWMHLKTPQSDSEYGGVSPCVQYLYEMEVPGDIQLTPGEDGEVEQYYLWDVDQVQKAMMNGEFKTSCALVLVEFFIRHGYITAENERNLAELTARMHRKLPFETFYEG